MEKTTVYLPRDLQVQIRAAARRAGRSQAELIREALYAYLDQNLGQSQPELTCIGIAEDGELSGADSEAWLEAEWERDLP